MNPQKRSRTIVEMQTRASFQPKEQALTIEARRVKTRFTTAPCVALLIPTIAWMSVVTNETNAPDVSLLLSKTEISC